MIHYSSHRSADSATFATYSIDRRLSAAVALAAQSSVK